MRLPCTLLVAIVLVLAANATATGLQVLASNDIPTIGHSLIPGSHRVKDKIYLRAGNLTKEQSDEDDSYDAEERAGTVKGFFSDLGTHIKMRFWHERGKSSDDYARKRLGLEGLTGTKLTSHPNYQKFLWYSHKAEGYKLNRWLRKDPPLSTYDGWVDLGLQKLVDGGISLKAIKETKGFETYAHYVKEFDQDVLILRKAWYTPKNEISRLASEVEMTAKAQIWAHNKMTDEYVLYALGVNKLSPEELVKVKDYQYFQVFKKAQG